MYGNPKGPVKLIKQVKLVWDKTWCTPWPTPWRTCGLPLFCKYTFINLAFEGIQMSSLVHISLEATAIHCMTCCYGNLVTMATEAFIYNLAV